jgi:glycine hydroxymethyltransferase
MFRSLSEDKEVFQIAQNELDRQRNVLNMIPSENYVSKAVLEATGSVLANKYAEGYPFKRYYQGMANVDAVEALAIERAKKLFGAEHANVQPYSGSPANMAIFFAVLKPGDKFLGMKLDQGGHLTHGSPVNFSGKLYNPIAYSVDKDTGRLNMDEVRALARKENPKMIISGFTAYPRTIDFKAFAKISEEVDAVGMSDISHIAGLVVGGAHPSPLPEMDIVMSTTHKTLRGPRGAVILSKEKFAKDIDKTVFPGMQGGPHENAIAAKAVAFAEAMKPEFTEYAHQIVKNAKALAGSLMKNGIKLVSGGTDNHLILIDLTPFGISLGKSVAAALEDAGICANMNTIPYDPGTPMKPSGIRLGTPILTTRGMKEPEMELVGKLISEAIHNYNDAGAIQKVRRSTRELCEKFPFY